MGSGGVVIESNKLKRKSIGVDINPMSVMIVNETLKKVDLTKLTNTFHKILEELPEDIKNLQQVEKNGEVCVIENAVWIGDKLKRVKINYKGKSIRRNAIKVDFEKNETAKKLLKKYKNEVSYSTDQIMRYVKRNQKEHINELFSDRNILIAGWFLKNLKIL